MGRDSLIDDRITRFRSDLPHLPANQIVRKYVTSGDSFILNEDQFFSLRQEIADQFSIHPDEVYLVGSAKLGFSIAPRKRYRPFGDTSDLDVAVVSATLFDDIWQDVFQYRTAVGYWPAEAEFKDYLFRGWIRPDKLPPARSFVLGKEWWRFFRKLTQSGRYGMCKIAGGIYRTHFFLETYQSICVGECKEEANSPT